MWIIHGMWIMSLHQSWYTKYSEDCEFLQASIGLSRAITSMGWNSLLWTTTCCYPTPATPVPARISGFQHTLQSQCSFCFLWHSNVHFQRKARQENICRNTRADGKLGTAICWQWAPEHLGEQVPRPAAQPSPIEPRSAATEYLTMSKRVLWLFVSQFV